jgi:hypothetical protein
VDDVAHDSTKVTPRSPIVLDQVRDDLRSRRSIQPVTTLSRICSATGSIRRRAYIMAGLREVDRVVARHDGRFYTGHRRATPDTPKEPTTDCRASSLPTLPGLIHGVEPIVELPTGSTIRPNVICSGFGVLESPHSPLRVRIARSQSGTWLRFPSYHARCIRRKRGE